MSRNSPITRPSVIEEVMPGWDGRESIVAYSIRMRREHDARLAAKMQYQLALAICAPLILAGVVGMVSTLMGWLQ